MVAEARRGAELPPLLLAARDAALAGRGDESRAILEQAARLAPNNGRVWVLLAEQRRQGGDPEGSLVAAAKAMEVGTNEEKSDALVCAGLVEVQRKQYLVAADRFRNAQRYAPTNELAYAFEAKSRLDGGDRLGARVALKRGLAAVPGGQHLEALRAEIGI